MFTDNLKTYQANNKLRKVSGHFIIEKTSKQKGTLIIWRDIFFFRSNDQGYNGDYWLLSIGA